MRSWPEAWASGLGTTEKDGSSRGMAWLEYPRECSGSGARRQRRGGEEAVPASMVTPCRQPSWLGLAGSARMAKRRGSIVGANEGGRREQHRERTVRETVGVNREWTRRRRLTRERESCQGERGTGRGREGGVGSDEERPTGAEPGCSGPSNRVFQGLGEALEGPRGRSVGRPFVVKVARSNGRKQTGRHG
jgi:hypothetical protein